MPTDYRYDMTLTNPYVGSSVRDTTSISDLVNEMREMKDLLRNIWNELISINLKTR